MLSTCPSYAVRSTTPLSRLTWQTHQRQMETGRDSVVAPQALYMMNSELVHQAADRIAGDPPEQLRCRRDQSLLPEASQSPGHTQRTPPSNALSRKLRRRRRLVGVCPRHPRFKRVSLFGLSHAKRPLPSTKSAAVSARPCCNNLLLASGHSPSTGYSARHMAAASLSHRRRHSSLPRQSASSSSSCTVVPRRWISSITNPSSPNWMVSPCLSTSHGLSAAIPETC